MFGQNKIIAKRIPTLIIKIAEIGSIGQSLNSDGLKLRIIFEKVMQGSRMRTTIAEMAFNCSSVRMFLRMRRPATIAISNIWNTAQNVVVNEFVKVVIIEI
jgi:hypothetical protein